MLGLCNHLYLYLYYIFCILFFVSTYYFMFERLFTFYFALTFSFCCFLPIVFIFCLSSFLRRWPPIKSSLLQCREVVHYLQWQMSEHSAPRHIWQICYEDRVGVLSKVQQMMDENTIGSEKVTGKRPRLCKRFSKSWVTSETVIEPKDKRYCFEREPYDRNKKYIRCDKCKQW